ncbi:hypothetical protein DM02DRAFT_622393 [Periconia macrospinosa]|uniref:Uncharacterized protein n=1 Tax=Periconia macrospinosa TaxID=97972 RepID=A0A2V1EAA1_9PLEO|nr:hypothetical protein DM02DRAFT_622393 [Periconia macrospinosa]
MKPDTTKACQPKPALTIEVVRSDLYETYTAPAPKTPGVMPFNMQSVAHESPEERTVESVAGTAARPYSRRVSVWPALQLGHISKRGINLACQPRTVSWASADVGSSYKEETQRDRRASQRRGRFRREETRVQRSTKYKKKDNSNQLSCITQDVVLDVDESGGVEEGGGEEGGVEEGRQKGRQIRQSLRV